MIKFIPVIKNIKFTGATKPNFSDIHTTTFGNMLINIKIIHPNIHVTEFSIFNCDFFIFVMHK